ncbi:MAG: iron-sulfur cluster biosynthesis protein [Acidimicrobiales bacterium]
MLQCTQTAAMSLQQLRRSQGVPDTFGVRVFAAETPEGEAALAIGFADRPAEGDQVAEQHGTQVFVAQEVAAELDEVELDMVPDVSGNGNQPSQLVLRSRPETAG